jgi:hypothetical protein
VTNPFDDDVEIALAELRRQHRRREAPAHLAVRLCAAAESRKPRAVRLNGLWLAAAAMVIAVVLLQSARPRPAAIERMTGFVALPGSEALPPPMQTSVWRLQLRQEDLLQYGFATAPPMAAGPVRAELLVGDDGLARAVRLVR